MGLANTGLFSLKAEIITWIRVVRSQRLWRGGEGQGEGQETELCTGNTAYVLLKHVKHFTKQSFEVAELRTDKTATMEQCTSEPFRNSDTSHKSI